jgi:hypothetical protein
LPVKIRIRCHYIDCKFIDGLYCGADSVEMDPKKFCLTYVPIEAEELDDDDLADDELEEDEVDWEEIGEEDDFDEEDVES